MDAMSEYFKDNEGSWTEELTYLRESVEAIAEDLPPDDDWMPMLFVNGILPRDMPTEILPTGVRFKSAGNNKDVGKPGIMAIGLAGGFMNSQEGKDAVANIMRLIAVKCEATAMSFLSCCWAAPAPEEYKKEKSPEDVLKKIEEDKNYVMPSKHPQRVEMLMIVSIDMAADTKRTVFAHVIREPNKHPRLENWRVLDGCGAGRFPDAMLSGLRVAKILRDHEKKEEK